MNIQETIANRLKETMTAKNVSIKQLSEKTGLSTNIINNILKVRVKRIRFKYIIKLCDILEISTDYLLGREN